MIPAPALPLEQDISAALKQQQIALNHVAQRLSRFLSRSRASIKGHRTKREKRKSQVNDTAEQLRREQA